VTTNIPCAKMPDAETMRVNRARSQRLLDVITGGEEERELLCAVGEGVRVGVRCIRILRVVGRLPLSPCATAPDTSKGIPPGAMTNWTSFRH
jgi:hypothetical protein